MESAFAWLGQLAEFIGSIFPRLLICNATHRGVKFVHGHIVKPIEPGLIIYWPLVTDTILIPVVRQTANLKSQTLTTKDGHSVIVGGVVVYRIRDAVAALSKNWDFDATIEDVAMVAIAEIVCARDYEALLTGIASEVPEALTKTVRRKLKSYGLQVYRVGITDFSQTFVLRNIGGMESVK